MEILLYLSLKEESSSMKKYFEVNVKEYVADRTFLVYRPASLNNPKSKAVMFITDGFMQYQEVFREIEECLVFWPVSRKVPDYIEKRHAVVKCENPHLEYCRFFQENNIVYLPKLERGKMENGAFIADSAVIGENAVIMPGAYVGGEVIIGDNVYIGAGTKLVGEVHIADGVIIRENSVIGADGLSTDRDENGKAVTMPQFGGVILEKNVQVGANTVIARGAIDNTVIEEGSKLDNQCFISHNVRIGRDTFVVGETIMFGSSSTGKQAYLSGNSTIRNGIHIGDNALVGMGAVVVKDVENGKIVKGNPAR